MQYYYGLDTLRAFMMILGIFIHGALFIGYADVSYHSMHGSNEVISIIVYFFTLFRMECFFLLCGFLANMIINKKSTQYFIKNRKERILIPLISSLIIFWTIPNFILNQKINFELQHLWFLLTLLILSAVTLSQRIRACFDQQNLSIKWLIFSFIAFSFNAALLMLQTKLPLTHYTSTLYSYFVTSPVYYAIFYFLGYMLFNKDNITKINRYKIPTLIIAIIFSVLSIYLYKLKYIDQDFGFVAQLIKVYADFICALAISLVLFTTMLLLNYSNKVFNFFKDSSLVIYVSHFSVILFLAPVVDRYTHSSTSFYFSLCLITLVICTLIYVFIKRVKFLHPLFGIK